MNKAEKNAQIIIPLISVIILIIFIGIFVFLVVSSGANTAPSPGSTQKGKVVPGNNGVKGVQCQVGECATDIVSGFKRCPSQNQRITTQPYEVCNKQFECNNPLTPYALQNDGSTSYLGQCEEGVACGCLRYSQCPEQIVSMFTTVSGNIFEKFLDQRLILNQEGNFVDPNGDTEINPPLSYQNPAASFCAIPPGFISVASPGCNFGNEVTCASLKACFGLPQGCNGVVSNPCLNGNLAILTSDSTSWTLNDLNNSSLACVAGRNCDCDEFPLYDINKGETFCKKIAC